MAGYINYSTENFEKFTDENHPKAVEELEVIIDGIGDPNGLYKAEIIVSYLKDHCLQNEWVKANPQLTKLITSGFLKTSNLESLFQSFKNNKVFNQNLEDFITRKIFLKNFKALE
jgi:hypothetical protein